MPILSVFAPLRKSRFFGSHDRYETLAERGRGVVQYTHESEAFL